MTHLLSPFTIFAVIAYGLLVAGLCMKKNPRRHFILISGGMGLDFLIVIALQVGKHVLNTVSSQPLSNILVGHILTSSIAILLYIPALVLGYQILKHPETADEYRPGYSKIIVTAFTFRTVGLILMFAMFFVG